MFSFMTEKTKEKMKRTTGKIINDPVLGFISLPFPILYDLLQHPWLLRLARIRQLGLSMLVYPGNTHSRLLHSLGAMHLTRKAIETLRGKGIRIEDEERRQHCAPSCSMTSVTVPSRTLLRGS